MSAFVVDREHIVYLVAAANHFNEGPCSRFNWYHRRKLHEFTAKNWDQTPRMLEIGTMLWEENIKSVLYRYEDCTRDNMPGPIGEDFKLREGDLLSLKRAAWSYKINPVQVLYSCNRYEYQACEHPGWRRSQAKAFLDALRDVAIRELPGYDKCDEWPGYSQKVQRARKARELREALETA